MERKRLVLWLRLVICGCALCGILLFVYVLPVWLLSLTDAYPHFHNWLWSALVWVLAAPCYAVLVLGLGIARDIGRGRSFTARNARRLSAVSTLALADAAVLFIGAMALCLVDRQTPLALPLASGVVCFIGVGVGVAAACLSHLVLEAARMREEQELTI